MAKLSHPAVSSGDADPDDGTQELISRYQGKSSRDPMTFFRGLLIPSATGPQRFAKCMVDYQIECFKAIAPSLIAVQKDRKPALRRLWWERTKKGGKDSDIAACLLWLVAFAQRPIFIQVGAADRDQAGIVKKRMEDILYYNPWLHQHVSINNYRVKSANGLADIEILAADVAGSHGATPDVLVVNELSHIKKWDFVLNLLDNARGVPHGIIVIATNAGWKGEQSEVLRQNALDSDGWFTHILDRPAPWITSEDLEEAKRTSKSLSRYRRLWWGVWSSSKGDAFDESEIDRCFRDDLEPLDEPQAGWTYLAGLDLGVKHDHSGLVVAGVNQQLRRIRVVAIREFVPVDGQVDLLEVEQQCNALGRLFRVQWFGYDPSQAQLMAQRLVKCGLPMVEVPFSSKNKSRMAEGLMQCVKSQVLESFPDDRLRRDFNKFNIVETKEGHKLEAVSDESGHADVGTALAILTPKAVSILNIGGMLMPEEDLVYDFSDENDGDGDELTDEELAELPEEFRGLVDDDGGFDEIGEELVRGRRRGKEHLYGEF